MAFHRKERDDTSESASATQRAMSDKDGMALNESIKAETFLPRSEVLQSEPSTSREELEPRFELDEPATKTWFEERGSWFDPGDAGMAHLARAASREEILFYTSRDREKSKKIGNDLDEAVKVSLVHPVLPQTLLRRISTICKYLLI